MSRRRQIRKWLAAFALWRWANRMMELAYSRAEARAPDGDPFWPNGGEPTARIKRLADSDQDIRYHLDRLRAKNWSRCHMCGTKANHPWTTGLCADGECKGVQDYNYETAITVAATREMFGC